MEIGNYKEPKSVFHDVEKLFNTVVEEGNRSFKQWEPLIEREEFKESALNLLYYLALRRNDIRNIQDNLIPLGLSSLGRLESKTLATLKSVLASLSRILGDKNKYEYPMIEEFNQGRMILEKNTEKVFGQKPQDYKTRIMVTMPTEAAKDLRIAEKFVEYGMNIARINCSHDNEEIWSRIIENVKAASRKYNKEVKIHMDIAGPKIRVEWIFTNNKNVKVSKGNELRLCSKVEDIMPSEDVVITIGTSIKQIFKTIEVGQRVLIDDGAIETIVKSIDERGVILSVTRVNGSVSKVKSEKGINFPETSFDVDILDEKDKKDLVFACNNADIICFSFIRTKEDIFEIQNELNKILGEKSNDKCIMAKIETPEGIEHLAEIIMAGASRNPFSIMIARGDLAVEIGYIRLAELQQEISWICEAASIPVVWATEVLANLVDNGVPTRAEVTDVAEGSLSECIMLNKGEYAVDAIKLLVKIFKQVEQNQYKKTPQLRALNIAKIKELDYKMDDIIIG